MLNGFLSFLNPFTHSEDANDDRNLSQIASADTVSTSSTITRFIPATARHVQIAEAQLKQRQEQQHHFFRLLEIKSKHSKLDTEANTRLFKCVAEEQQEITQRRIGRYPVKVAIEQSRLATAKADHNLKTVRVQVDAQIAQLQQAQKDIGKQLKGGKDA